MYIHKYFNPQGNPCIHQVICSIFWIIQISEQIRFKNISIIFI